ncbi:MAG: hypothetical protein N2510_00925 [Ignavibacteria bacterium]|nr:hypothetical protein [Ignavibacteria bacterium]
MKAYQLLVPLFFMICEFCYSQSATTMQDILAEVNQRVKNLEEQKHQEIVNITLDLLSRNGEKRIYRYLDPSFTYDVIAFGDRRINRIKLKVGKLDTSTGEVNLIDEYSAETAQIRIKPSEFEQYVFIVSVDEYRKGDSVGHFAIILYHENPEHQ